MNRLMQWPSLAMVGAILLLAVSCGGGEDGTADGSPAVSNASAAPFGEAVPPGITVPGYGRAVAKPDKVVIQLSLRSTGKSFGVVSQQDVQKITGFLKDAGVDEKHIELLANVTLFPEEGVLVVTAQLGEVDKVDGVLEAFSGSVGDLGGYDIEGATVLYTVNECSPLEERARKEALEDAENRAQGYASALGHSLGPVTSVYEVPVGAFNFPSNPSWGCKAVEKPPLPGYGLFFSAEPNSPKEVTVTTTLLVTYAIE